VDRAHSVELQAWRALGRHRGDLLAMLAEMSGVLGGNAPLASARIWRLAPDEATLLADWAPPERLPAPPVRVRIGAREHERIGSFLGTAKACTVDESAPREVLHLTGPRGGLVAGLGGPVGAEGAVTFTFEGATPPTAARALEAVLPALAAAYAHADLARELAALQAAATPAGKPRRFLGDDGIVGATGGLRHALERVAEVARTDLPVVLLGETGSGKEVVARAVHDASNRASGPFHRVNCGAISPELIDSELFGHERGSFTGASAQRQGWFTRADGGTLFLDEIAELPLPAQVRLLRVLQDGTFERVGGERSLHVDVRVVAATHRNLVAMVASGRFRQDLWFRIAAFVIDLPPLRDRAEDMSALASHFARRAATKFGLPMVTPSAEDIALLNRYPWPGNVRELATVIDRAVLLGAGSCLRVERALGIPVVRALTMAPPPAGDEPPAEVHTPPRVGGEATLDAVLATHIQTALQASRGRVDGPFGAAGRLGVTASMLRARMRKLGIDWRTFRR
jgi:transcriptional regulator with GAF, ATPase, and Fis domain